MLMPPVTSDLSDFLKCPRHPYESLITQRFKILHCPGEVYAVMQGTLYIMEHFHI